MERRTRKNRGDLEVLEVGPRKEGAKDGDWQAPHIRGDVKPRCSESHLPLTEQAEPQANRRGGDAGTPPPRGDRTALLRGLSVKVRGHTYCPTDKGMRACGGDEEERGLGQGMCVPGRLGGARGKCCRTWRGLPFPVVGSKHPGHRPWGNASAPILHTNSRVQATEPRLRRKGGKLGLPQQLARLLAVLGEKPWLQQLGVARVLPEGAFPT